MDSETTASGAGRLAIVLIILLLTGFKTFILNVIGTLTALDQPVVIPIILRTLAASIALYEEGDLPFECTPDFLAVLDAGEFEKDIVIDFDLNWWSGRKPRDLNAVEILNASTVDTCLEHYTFQQESKESKSGRRNIPNPGPGSGLTNEALLFHNTNNAGKSKTPPVTGRPAATNVLTGTGTGCASCSQYRQLLSDVLRDILRYQNFASVMATSSKNLFNIGSRKASTFNLLYETAVLKETAGVSLPAKSSVERISNERGRASPVLKEMPASSYKWIWGESLTEKDVISLCRAGTSPKPIVHSGYDISLGEGRMEGKYSDPSELLLSLSIPNEDLPEEVSFIPPSTDHQLPAYFSKCDALHYNPLQTSQSGSYHSSGRDSAGIPEPGHSVLSLADTWLIEPETDSGPGVPDPGPSVLTLADTWFGDSSHDSGPELPKVPEPVPSVLNLADSWFAGPETDSGPIPEPGPSVLALADTWIVEPDNDTGSGIVGVPEPGHSALSLADNWITDSNHDSGHDSGPELSDVPDPGPLVISLADGWIAEDSVEEPGSEPGPSVLNLAETWFASADLPDPVGTFPSQISGTDSDTGPEVSGVPETSITSGTNPAMARAELPKTSTQILGIPSQSGSGSSDRDGTGSGSEYDDGTESEIVEAELEDDEGPGPEDEEVVAPGSGGLKEGDWSYGGDHFSDLKAEMFIDSSDEDF